MIQMEPSFIISPKMLHGLTSSSFSLNPKNTGGNVEEGPIFLLLEVQLAPKKMGSAWARPVLHVVINFGGD